MSTVSSATAILAGAGRVEPVHRGVGPAIKHMGIAAVRGEFSLERAFEPASRPRPRPTRDRAGSQ
jgi:polyisoprenoid-binding protein YceI